MKLDLTVIKNESILKMEKSLKKVKEYYEDLLSIALDAAIHEVDADKRQEVEVQLNDMLNDYMASVQVSFTKCMNNCSNFVVDKLSC